MNRLIAVVVCALYALAMPGCGKGPELVAPELLVSPYGGPASEEPLWAVAPLNNESGASIADILRITDAIMARTAEVRGMAVLPVNRTIAAMRALNMPAVTCAEDARRLADTLGADVIVVGSLTAYDPYDPPKIGLTLALYGRTAGAAVDLDPVALSGSTSEATIARAQRSPDAPLSVTSLYLDAANHGVMMDIKRYAEGRSERDSALGWRVYLVSMDHFTAFAAYQGVGKLLNKERLRLARSAVAIKSEAQ